MQIKLERIKDDLLVTSFGTFKLQPCVSCSTLSSVILKHRALVVNKRILFRGYLYPNPISKYHNITGNHLHSDFESNSMREH